MLKRCPGISLVDHKASKNITAEAKVILIKELKRSMQWYDHIGC